jgi:hypothetical protein
MDKLDKTGTLQSVIKDGKVNKDALIQGLGGLLNKNQPPAVQPEAAPTSATAPASQAMPTPPEVQADTETTTRTDDSTAAATKTTKNKKKTDVEDVGRQLLQNFLGGQ